MITRRTQIQLAIFVIITLVGVSFVGARYARLDRFFVDDAYTVVAHFPDSGGIYSGAEVDYRGVRVGKVTQLELTDDGVDLHLEVNDEFDQIPADARAVVANRSAVGEQFVDLQPQSDSEPYLSDGSEIAPSRTDIPIATDKLLTDLTRTVNSVNRRDLQTVVGELGTAFEGTGPHLQQIIDTGNSFIETANENFDVTTALIRDANTVLNTQLDSAGDLRTFAREMERFSTTLAGSDRDLRRVINRGSATANQLRTFIERNDVPLSQLLNNLVTTGEVMVQHLDGIEQFLVAYPYVVEGGFTVAAKDPQTGLYNAHFGMVLTEEPPVCHEGYGSTDTRPPHDRADKPMNTQARCTEPPGQTNPRGANDAPQRAPADYEKPVAAYDPETGELAWGADAADRLPRPGSLAPESLGKESWKWLFLQPLTNQGR